MKHLFRILFVVILTLFIACKSTQIQQSSENHIFIEAENTISDLNNWKIVKEGDENYVSGASGEQYLEFMGNKPITGKANSPLTYEFTAPKSGNFQLMLMTSKRLEGVKSDWCNDAFVRLSGDFDSANTLSKEALNQNIKILQDGNDEVPELEWHWASTAEKDRHVYNTFEYQLKKGQKYILTVSGRSMRFSVDYIVLFNMNAFETNKAKQFFKNK